MLREQGQHVVKKRDAGANGRLSRSVNLQRQRNPRFPCSPAYLCLSSTHTYEINNNPIENKAPILQYVTGQPPPSCTKIASPAAQRRYYPALCGVTRHQAAQVLCNTSVKNLFRLSVHKRLYPSTSV